MLPLDRIAAVFFFFVVLIYQSTLQESPLSPAARTAVRLVLRIDLPPSARSWRRSKATARGTLSANSSEQNRRASPVTGSRGRCPREPGGCWGRARVRSNSTAHVYSIVGPRWLLPRVRAVPLPRRGHHCSGWRRDTRRGPGSPELLVGAMVRARDTLRAQHIQDACVDRSLSPCVFEGGSDGRGSTAAVLMINKSTRQERLNICVMLIISSISTISII